MLIQTWLSCHKFISVENITILSVSSDDFFYTLYSKLQNSKCGVTVRMGKRKKLNSLARAEGVKILAVRSIQKQEWGFSVGQSILIYALVYIYIYIYIYIYR